MNDRLQTSARMYKYGISEELKCLICDGSEEDQDHLLMQCKYSRDIWRQIMHWLQIKINHTTIGGIARWIQRCRVTSLRSRYTLQQWLQWFITSGLLGLRCFGKKKVVLLHVVVNRIQRSVVDRVYGIIPKKVNRSDREGLRIITQQVVSR